MPGTGIHVNNVMGEEDLNPLGFRHRPPGRRMPSMMAPTVVASDDGEVELASGSAGSNRIRSAILQTIVGVVDHGLEAQAAVPAPRTHFEAGVVYTEPGIDLEDLRAAGHEIAAFPAPQPLLRRRPGGGARGAHRHADRRGRPAARRRCGRGVRRAAAATLAAVVTGCVACGGEAGDLLAVERTGSIPGARLGLRFTVDGRVACNRGAAARPAQRAGRRGAPHRA